MNIDQYLKNQTAAAKMTEVFAAVPGDSDYAHDLRCGFALAIHNGADHDQANDDAVTYANNWGRSALERTTVI